MKKITMNSKAVIFVVVLLLLPYVFLVNSFSQINEIKQQLTDSANQIGELGEAVTQFQVFQEAANAPIEPLPSGEKRTVYLTFDDGPGPYTEQLLNILKEKDVQATFFVIQRTGETEKALYNRIVQDGHTLAMHSTNHVYKSLYSSGENVLSDTRILQQYLFEVTGTSPFAYRFPGGTSNTIAGKGVVLKALELLQSNNYKVYDWNVSSMDTVEKNPDKIATNILEQVAKYKTAIVLQHDTMKASVEATGGLIDQLKKSGCEFKRITEDTKENIHAKR